MFRYLVAPLALLGVPVGLVSAQPSVSDAESPTEPTTATATTGVVTAMSGRTVADAVLVGPSGELYRPHGAVDGALQWQRSTPGGVAAQVRSAIAPTNDPSVVVAGARSPMYQLRDGVWHALRLPHRGRTHVTRAGADVVAAVGRQMLLWRDRSWRPLAQTRGQVSLLWASSRERVYAALTRGSLDRWQKGSWNRVKTRLANGDSIELFAGRPGKKLYAFTAQGVVLDVGARSARAVPSAPQLAGFVTQAAAVAKDGTLWAAGLQSPIAADASEQSPAQSPRVVLAQRAPGRNQPSTLVEPLPMVAASDRITVLLVDASGTLLIATRTGRVFTRPAQQSWSEGRLSVQLPSKGSQPTAGPARTR